MNPPPNLNPLARLYRWMEWFTFGPALGRCRRAFLPELLSSRRALALGDGDGRFTARLLRANPRVHIDAVDASSAMLRQLLRRAGPHAPRVRTHCADARLWQPASQPYDLVFAHFFLDFLTPGEVLALARRLRPAVSPSALWAVSEFVVPPSLFGRLVARPVVAGLYRAFGLLTGLKVRRLPDHPRALAQAGFTLLGRRTFLRGLLVSELWQPCPVPASKTFAASPSKPATEPAEVLQAC
ncbi:MAG TPA: class I SAM-dependent methyltransferase [Terracidiphilus sp.]|nr:class I SAM-dependent methyltransferase [Terracidiphilus sp.]